MELVQGYLVFVFFIQFWIPRPGRVFAGVFLHGFLIAPELRKKNQAA